jgi:hypothetical protein
MRYIQKHERRPVESTGFDIYAPWEDHNLDLDEITRRFHRHLRARYFQERGRAVNLMLEYVRFFSVSKNYQSFPFGPLFLPSSTEMELRWCTVLQALKFPWALSHVLDKHLESGRDGGYERAAAFRKGVATLKFRNTILAALNESFADGLDEAPYEGNYFALNGHIVWVVLPPGSL